MMSNLNPDDIELTWRILEGALPPVSELRIREIDELGPPGARPLFAIDGTGQRQLLLPVPPDAAIIEDRRSSGVQLHVRNLMDQGEKRDFAVLICQKPHLNELFSVIVSDVLLRIANGHSRPDLAAAEVLDRWRELLERARSEKPSADTVTGLFGELWQLKQLMGIRQTALRCWTGPLGSRHDFTSGETALETKASLFRQGRKITIHGHEQLEAPRDGSLYLSVVKLDSAVNRGENLRDLFEAVCRVGADRYEMKHLIARAGIPENALDLCDDMRYVVSANWVFVVNENFPRITSDSFRGRALPARVSQLIYTIDLTGEPPYPLPDEEVRQFYISFASEVQQ